MKDPQPRNKPLDIDSASEVSKLKVEINTLIWMYAPEDLTLKKADEMACLIFDMIQSGVTTIGTLPS